MRYLILVLGLLVAVGGLAAIKYGQISMLVREGTSQQAAGPPPETVSTTVVREQTWVDRVEAVATVVAAEGVTVSSDVPGVVSRIDFESGATVKRGQVLVELDATLERAQLSSIGAKRQLAENVLGRSRALVESGAIANAQLEVDEASLKSLIADEQTLEAQVARKVIRAPFSGRLGIRAVNLGQYLAPGTAIASLESTKTLYVEFSLPQERLPQLRLEMPLQAYLGSADSPIATGTIRAIEPSVDAVTRSVKVRANLSEMAPPLSAGMFLRVVLEQSAGRNVATIPATAVVHAAYGNSVFRVEEQVTEATTAARAPPKKLARQQFVKLGELRGDYVAVLDGLTPGQEVVTAGAFKLRNGVPLVVDNDVRLDPSLGPNPVNR